MQHRFLLAFRKRAKNRGYRDISIKFAGLYNDEPDSEPLYTVSAIDPLSCTYVHATYVLSTFSKLLR